MRLALTRRHANEPIHRNYGSLDRNYRSMYRNYWLTRAMAKEFINFRCEVCTQLHHQPMQRAVREVAVSLLHTDYCL